MVKISQHAFDQIQFIKYHKKEQNESLTNLKQKKNKLGQYRTSWPIGRVFLYWPSFSIFAVFVPGMMRADLAIRYCIKLVN